MKIAVLNFSGNVGKTTIAAHLLKPRMPNARIYSVESINSGADASGVEVEKLRGKKFGSMIDAIMLLDEAIIDVGASNVEDFMKMMQQYAGSHEEMDYFIVPVVKEKKVQEDTVNTIRALRTIGIPAKKIRVVFNKLDVDESPSDEFPSLYGLAASEKSCIVTDDATIRSNEVFERLKTLNKSLGDLVNDPVDYRQKLREATSQEDKEHCVQMVALKRLSVTADENMQRVFKAITK
ncbi:MAG: plasmid stabilization protein [Bacteroidetes bacterium]|nr:plasmid stabilization protein [Bacteroidota bacterium]